MKLEHPFIGMVIRKCVFFNFYNKDIMFCWVRRHTGIGGTEKADSAAKSSLELPRLVYPILILNIVSASVFFSLGKVIGMMRLRTSFILI